MDFHPNYYSLAFVSPIGQTDSINSFKINRADKALIDCLRLDLNFVGQYRDNLIISSPDILDFFGDTGPFAKKLINLFPKHIIFVTYYNSVTSQRGICQIVNSKVDKNIYQDEINESNIDTIEEEYMLNHFGIQLPAILGLDIKMGELT
jgi:hypothetical protein